MSWILTTLISAAAYVAGYVIAGPLGVLAAILVYRLFQEFVLGPALVAWLWRTGGTDKVRAKLLDTTEKALRRWQQRAAFLYGTRMPPS